MDPGPQLDAALRASATRSFLAQHPEAPIATIGNDGVLVPVPASLPLGRHPVVEARSGLDLVTPECKAAVITGWELARKNGASRTIVRLVSDPDRPVALHFFDARPEHGVYIGVFASTDGRGEVPLARVAEALPPPRFCTIRKSELAVVVAIDKSTTQILGWSEEELLGRRTLELIHPDDQALAIDNWMEMLAAKGPGRRVRLRHQRRDGTWVWIEVTNHNLLDDPDYGCVLAEMVDISEEMATEEAMRAREQLLHRLAEALPLGVLQVDSERKIAYANERLGQVVGIVGATTVDEQLASVVPEDQRLLSDALSAALALGIDADIEVKVRHPSTGELRLCTLALRSLTNDASEVTGAIVCVADVTESAAMHDELERRATFDMLTGCHNRASIMSSLEETLASHDSGLPPAVIFVDLDRFKQVNDQWGHAAGDELLAIVAGRLRAALRSCDVVGRIGGDEFLVVCHGVSGAEEAMSLAERITAKLGQDVLLTEGLVALRASVGVAWSADPEITADALVAQADSAMYESKRRGVAVPVFA